MRISLVITTYNWPQALNVTLASVGRQKRMPDEVIVADDGSDSETAAVVQHWSKTLPYPVRHFWQEDVGFRLARARNRAIDSSSGDYIVQVDGDMVLHPKFILDHAATARPDCFVQGARPKLSEAVTTAVLDSGTPDVTLMSPGMERRIYALRSPLLSRIASKARFTLDGIQACNQSFWREHFMRVNGYDERFTGWGPEDREFAARLLHIGVRRNYVRHLAIAYHLHHPSRAPNGENPFDRLLHETLQKRAVRCSQGVDSSRA
jgi:glycosyltransferase involved in cell wall biosynthesis